MLGRTLVRPAKKGAMLKGTNLVSKEEEVEGVAHPEDEQGDKLGKLWGDRDGKTAE